MFLLQINCFRRERKLKIFDSRAEEGFILGNSGNPKTYLTGSIENGFLKPLQTRNVKFNESVFPGSECFHRRICTNDIVFEIDERGR